MLKVYDRKSVVLPLQITSKMSEVIFSPYRFLDERLYESNIAHARSSAIDRS